MIARFSQRISRFAFAGLLAAVLLATASPAHAQFGEAAGIAEAMVPDYLSRDISLFSKGLELDETQRVIIEALFNDYQDAFEAGMAKMKQKFEDMRPELVDKDEPRVLKLVFSPFAEWGEDKGKIGEQFIDNVKVVLTPEQMEKWPAFERQLRREKEMSKGRLSGESIDLIDLLRGMHLDDATMHAVQPVMDEYDVALDKALRDRKAVGIEMRPAMLKAMAEQDGRSSMDLFEKLIRAQVAVRDVNDRFIESISTALPAADGAKFKSAALERAYPRIYRESAVERMFVSARDIEGLTPEVQKSIDDLDRQFRAALVPMNEGLLRELRKWDPEEQKQHAATFASRLAGTSGERVDDPTRDSFLKREEVYKQYAKSLQALLTPEQFGLLPGSYRWVGEENAQKPGPKATGPAKRGAQGNDSGGLQPQGLDPASGGK